MIRTGSAGRVFAAAAALVALAGCGKKGPPLAPLHLVPARVEDLKAIRRGNEVELRFVLPKTNVNGPGPVNLDHIEVFAMTVAPGAPTPPNRELTLKMHLVGTVAVKPLPEEGGPSEAKPEDKRPSPGEPAVFLETLTEDKLKPVPPKVTRPSAAQKTAEPLPFLQRAATQHATRFYVLRGASRGGRPGAPSAQVAIPLAAAPPSPSDVKVTFTEEALTLNWTAPPPPEDPAAAASADWMFLAPQFPYLFYREAPAKTTFNVYLSGEPASLNPAPIAETTFTRAAAGFGVEQCYVVRTVRTTGSVAVESGPSDRICLTPADTFPPAAPQGLQAVAGAGDINLSWDANREADLGGYIVLRGEAPGATLQALFSAPIADTRYRDTNVKQGVRYVYAVVAVDTAKPPNMSAQSARADETAR